MKFDLETVNWQTISVIITTFSVLGAYFFPIFRDRVKLSVTVLANKIDIDKVKITLFIKNIGRLPVSITSYKIRYNRFRKNEDMYFFPVDNLQELIENLGQYKTYDTSDEVKIEDLKNLKNIIVNESSGKYFGLKKNNRKYFLDYCKKITM